MFTDWFFYTIFITAIIYLLIMLNYAKAQYKKTHLIVEKKDKTIQDLKLLIKKYRIQLQRAIGDIDILTEELSNARNDLKTMRAKNSQQRLENDQLIQKVKELEEKIEALIQEDKMGIETIGYIAFGVLVAIFGAIKFLLFKD